jgi:hypothetical protein
MIIVLYSLIGTITCPDSRDYDPKRNRDTSVIFQWNYLVHFIFKGQAGESEYCIRANRLGCGGVKRGGMWLRDATRRHRSIYRPNTLIVPLALDA